MSRPPRVALLACALLPGCSVVFDLGGLAEGDAPIGDGVGIRAPGGDADEAPPLEECNGVDDDGDGSIDEGFTDYDDDGLADCDGPTCAPLDAGVAGPVPVVDACTSMPDGPITGAWAARVSWAWALGGDDGRGGSGLAAPVVAQLDDDNLDGQIDDRDTPDVIVHTAVWDPLCNCSLPGLTVAIDGRTGEEKWRSTASGDGIGPLVADLDADGAPEVVTGADDGGLLVLEADGTPLWTSSATRTLRRVRPPLAADLESDGRPELIVGRVVLDGSTGRVRFELDEPYPLAGGTAAVADVDLDGLHEIFYQGSAFAADGRLLWKAEIDGSGGLWPVIVQADEDTEAEIAWVGHTFSVWQHDGAALATPASYVGSAPGAPCAGDLDNDGEAEIAWLDGTELYAYDLDGSRSWTATVTGAAEAGCSTFDLDGDQGAELLLLDDGGLRVVDGRSGQVLLTRDTGYVPAAGSYPVVADLDLDGHAEIVASGVGEQGESVVEAIEHDGSGWAPAGGTWPSYDYAVGNVLAAGKGAHRPVPWWTQYASFRGRPAGDFVSRPDLTVTITDVCVADCDVGPVRVAVQVANQGGRDQYAGGRLVLYAVDGSTRREVASTTLPAIGAGYALGGIEFELSPDSLGTGGWLARVEDDGSDADYLSDCDLDNQQDQWAAECLPEAR